MIGWRPGAGIAEVEKRFGMQPTGRVCPMYRTLGAVDTGSYTEFTSIQIAPLIVHRAEIVVRSSVNLSPTSSSGRP